MSNYSYVDTRAFAKCRKRALAVCAAAIVFSVAVSRAVEDSEIKVLSAYPGLPPRAVVKEKPYWQRFESKKRKKQVYR